MPNKQSLASLVYEFFYFYVKKFNVSSKISLA